MERRWDQIRSYLNITRLMLEHLNKKKYVNTWISEWWARALGYLIQRPETERIPANLYVTGSGVSGPVTGRKKRGAPVWRNSGESGRVRGRVLCKKYGPPVSPARSVNYGIIISYCLCVAYRAKMRNRARHDPDAVGGEPRRSCRTSSMTSSDRNPPDNLPRASLIRNPPW